MGVKADEQTSKMLEEFTRNREIAHIAENQAGPDGEEIKPHTDDEIREQILKAIREKGSELLEGSSIHSRRLASLNTPSSSQDRTTGEGEIPIFLIVLFYIEHLQICVE